jgi:hypothetical protein
VSRVSKTKAEAIVTFIEEAGHGYAVAIDGGTLVVAHAAFSLPLKIAVGGRNADEVLAMLERYRNSLAPKKGE